MKLVYLIAGARPNFMKIAPIVRALQGHESLRYRIIHTGQHYDREMNEVFFEELGIPKPDVFMGAGGGSHAQQTAKIMLGFEELCQVDRPDAVVVVGDVNSTLACAIVAKKAGIPVAHVEAGLRSGDMAMPEEINRLVTDSISDWFFATEPSAVVNLRKEGKPEQAIHFVGHVMVDNLLHQVAKLDDIDSSALEMADFKRDNAAYGVVTLHRPSNVDDAEVLTRISSAIRELSEQLPLIFPVHPRSRKNFERFGIDWGPRVTLTNPLAYMPFLNLWRSAVVVITDSGGLQEETTSLGVPCITVRSNTERPITVEEGTNVLVGSDPDLLLMHARRAINLEFPRGRRPDLWDGKAAERIVSTLAKELN